MVTDVRIDPVALRAGTKIKDGNATSSAYGDSPLSTYSQFSMGEQCTIVIEDANSVSREIAQAFLKYNRG